MYISRAGNQLVNPDSAEDYFQTPEGPCWEGTEIKVNSLFSRACYMLIRFAGAQRTGSFEKAKRN